ncbi:MAG: alpha/beta fold hydrolase [Hyphomicrobiaceae bacterium]
MARQARDPAEVALQGQALSLTSSGSGRRIVFLPAGIWYAPDDEFADRLATLGRVVTPVHPGFRGGSIKPHLTNADDLAYLYLDLLDYLSKSDANAGGVVLVGASFGAFVAAQMAIKSHPGIDGLVLIGAAGVKAGGRHDRDIVDLFAHPQSDLVRMTFADPSAHDVDLKAMPEEAVRRRVEAREALARFAWEPYMHDPKLPVRLGRVGVPALVLHGSADQIVARQCAELYAERIPQARLQLIEGAGHLPHVEAPEETLAAIAGFINGLPPSAEARSSKQGSR